MKKQHLPLLLILTAAFFTFTLGFCAGYNQRTQDISFNTLPTLARHNAVPEAAEPDEKIAEPVFPVDINTADLYTLTTLPGIGETLARRIVQYRETYGPFPQPEELLNVEGLGPGTLERLLDYVTTGG